MKHAKDEKQAIVQGQVVSVKTLSNNHCRIEIDIQPEKTPSNLIDWRFQLAAVALLDEKQMKKPKKPRPYYKVGNVKVKRW